MRALLPAGVATLMTMAGTDTGCLLAVDPGRHAGVAVHLPRMGEPWVERGNPWLAWAVEGARPDSVRLAVDAACSQGANTCVVEWPRRRTHDRASWASLGTMFERAAYWIAFATVANMRIVRVDPAVWQRATGAVRPEMRFALVRAEGIVTDNIDVASAVCIGLWALRR